MIKSLDRMIADVPKRFERLYIPEPNSGCWIWIGGCDKAGYGRFTIGRPGTHRMVGAHIISYILAHGRRPESELDHLCKMRCCVNPEHLEPVTHIENLRRGDGWGGINFRKTHCVNGHEFTPENTYVWRSDKVTMRQCRICGRQNTADYLARKAAKNAV